MVEVTRQQVEAVLDEYDLLEPTTSFLDKHQFGQPRDFWVKSPYRAGDRKYPAKAVAAVALGWSDINGGYSKPDSACNVLERAGYLIVGRDGAPIDDSPETLIKILNVQSAGLGKTEAEAIVKRRIGQNIFRNALLARWGRHCPMTGIGHPDLLRASHIIPWSKCKTDFQRLDVNNGILLSALWDAAFDALLVTFADDGTPIASRHMNEAAKQMLGFDKTDRIWLDDKQLPYIAWHRAAFEKHEKN